MHISELANRHVDISIHALHEESEIDLDKQGKATVFQSTLSMRRAIDTTLLLNQFFTISIHALHEESDAALRAPFFFALISIHALHEESD